MVSERDQIEKAIGSVESQRRMLGSAATDAAMTGLRQKLSTLELQSSSEQRKMVTVLFGDVSGLTKVAEDIAGGTKRRIGAQGLMLQIIVGVAGLLENQGDYQRATEWLAFALNYPGANEDTRQVAKPIIKRHGV